MINRILHSWSFHMKFMKLAKGSFHKFHIKDHSCKILYIKVMGNLSEEAALPFSLPIQKYRQLILSLWDRFFLKLTMSLDNDLLKFQTLIPQIRQYFLLKKCEKLLKLFLFFFQQKI